MVENLFSGDKLLAIIVRSSFNKPGVNFCTPHNLSQQLAFISHPPGRLIEPHVHNPLPREVLYTQEVLIIRKGRIRVDFYEGERTIIASRELQAGDVILLAEGGARL